MASQLKNTEGGRPIIETYEEVAAIFDSLIGKERTLPLNLNIVEYIFCPTRLTIFGSARVVGPGKIRSGFGEDYISVEELRISSPPTLLVIRPSY